MPSTLEINLTSGASGIKLASTHFKNDEKGCDRWLMVSGEEQRINFEPDKDERIRYGTPQRALLVLLLRAFSSTLVKYCLTTEASPELARSLLNIWQKQLRKQTETLWLHTLVALPANGNLKDWFNGEGSTSPDRHGQIQLGLKWKTVTLVVKVNNTQIPTTEYEKYARQIELDHCDEKPAAKVAIERFELKVWNSVLGCFSRGSNGVKHGDRVQLEIQLNQPAHVYVLWLDWQGRVVTLHPWSGPDWTGLINDEPLESLTLPEPSSDGETSALQVEGMAGVENILILARREPISRKDAQMFRGMIEGSKVSAKCPKCEVMVSTKHDGTPRITNPTRTIRRLGASPDVKLFQAGLASDLTPHFDQVLVCSFPNEGKIK